MEIILLPEETTPMPTCRHCNRQIEKFETDICPYCGGKDPIPASYKTMDITKNIAKVDGKSVNLYKSKSQAVYANLCLFLGFAGIHNFYIKKPKLGYIDIAITAFIIALMGSLLTFLTPLQGFGYLIAFGVAFLLFAIYSFYLRQKDSPRDGEGEFLR